MKLNAMEKKRRRTDPNMRVIICANIKALRMRKFPGKGGQQKCCAEFGTSQQQWSQWERGKHRPDEVRLDQIARFFKVKPDELRIANRFYDEEGQDILDLKPDDSLPLPPLQPKLSESDIDAIAARVVVMVMRELHTISGEYLRAVSGAEQNTFGKSNKPQS